MSVPPAIPEPLDLVIFDCDGVLVDSEPISMEVLVEVVTAAGIRITQDEAYTRFLGKSMASICEALRDEDGLVMTSDHLETIRRKLYTRFERDLKPIPGIGYALDQISLPKCVASSSQPERIRLSLTITGLMERLGDRIFSSTMVSRGKPAPDLFLHAAGEMNVPADRCLVIEDSLAGISAARAAGMGVFGFIGGSHAHRPDHLTAMCALEPDAIFDDMKLLPGLVDRRKRGNRRP